MTDTDPGRDYPGLILGDVLAERVRIEIRECDPGKLDIFRDDILQPAERALDAIAEEWAHAETVLLATNGYASCVLREEPSPAPPAGRFVRVNERAPQIREIRNATDLALGALTNAGVERAVPWWLTDTLPIVRGQASADQALLTGYGVLRTALNAIIAALSDRALNEQAAPEFIGWPFSMAKLDRDAWNHMPHSAATIQAVASSMKIADESLAASMRGGPAAKRLRRDARTRCAEALQFAEGYTNRPRREELIADGVSLEAVVFLWLLELSRYDLQVASRNSRLARRAELLARATREITAAANLAAATERAILAWKEKTERREGRVPG